MNKILDKEFLRHFAGATITSISLIFDLRENGLAECFAWASLLIDGALAKMSIIFSCYLSYTIIFNAASLHDRLLAKLRTLSQYLADWCFWGHIADIILLGDRDFSTTIDFI